MIKILKFGGSSIATAEGMKRVAEIVLSSAKTEQVIIVVSALRGITDQLLECVGLAEKGQKYQEILQYINNRHDELLSHLVKKEDDPAAFESLQALSNSLYKILDSISCLRDNNLNIRDLVIGFGEQFSATIASAYLNLLFRARYVDSLQISITLASSTAPNTAAV